MEGIQHVVRQFDGLKLHIIPTAKYKTNTLMLRLKAPLTEDTVTYRALLPYVLQSGTSKLPSAKAIRQHLEGLYGASLAVDVNKKGESHIISIYMDVANEIYLQDSSPLLEQTIATLADVLLHPVLEGEAFQAAIVESEKRALQQRIESTFDDKMRYANQRMLEEMCKNEPYHLNPNGRKEDIAAITPQTLYSYYQKAIAEDEIDLYVVGDIKEDIGPLIQKYFSLAPREGSRQTSQEPSAVDVKEVIEKQDVNQGKLHMGYRAHITYGDSDYYALQVFNGLYGGFSHSKLFINVREKNSLAYYAGSRYESHKGLLLIMSGIEDKNYEKAVTIIKEQMTAMQKGEFTEEELTQTKAVIKNQILEAIDTARGLVEILYHDVIAHFERPMTEWLTEIDKVTKEEVVAVANKMEIDTIYFLRGLEGA
ncbi:pitrilysin family protein [Bacillus sp. 165]|uniref:EF-P 5-aminopentanol modification-associated protein YfmF n=1 Tax=Bacillus sp. 165 TaxID=1529117 RepID=UPI001ADBBD8C|nr:pitrilysin family protein [Bacillus sp. 165]MBO9128888.1 insulinase family protein [Bacillus sp. 165]